MKFETIRAWLDHNIRTLLPEQTLDSLLTGWEFLGDSKMGMFYHTSDQREEWCCVIVVLDELQRKHAFVVVRGISPHGIWKQFKEATKGWDNPYLHEWFLNGYIWKSIRSRDLYPLLNTMCVLSQSSSVEKKLELTNVTAQIEGRTL